MKKSFYICRLDFPSFTIFSSHLNWGTNCTPVGRQLRIAGAHLLDVLLGIGAFRQNRHNVLHGEIPFFLFLVPRRADTLVLK